MSQKFKKELGEILKSEDNEALKNYIQSNKPLDYLFSMKMGDSNFSVNPLIYTLMNNSEMAAILIGNIDDLLLTDMISSGPIYSLLLCSIFSNEKNKSVLPTLYRYVPLKSKEELSYDLSTRVENLENIKQFLKPKHLLDRLIKEDSEIELKALLREHPRLLRDGSKNYLQECISQQAVLCFDVIKTSLQDSKRLAIVQNLCASQVKNRFRFGSS